jgi:hypothetical protein
LEVSRKATEKGLEILRQSAKGSRPQDAARLLAIGDAIGRNALGLSGAEASQVSFAFGMRPVPTPNILRMRRDAQSDYADALTRKYLRENPEHPQASLRANELREHEKSDRELLRNGANDQNS